MYVVPGATPSAIASVPVSMVLDERPATVSPRRRCRTRSSRTTPGTGSHGPAQVDDADRGRRLRIRRRLHRRGVGRRVPTGRNSAAAPPSRFGVGDRPHDAVVRAHHGRRPPGDRRRRTRPRTRPPPRRSAASGGLDLHERARQRQRIPRRNDPSRRSYRSSRLGQRQARAEQRGASRRRAASTPPAATSRPAAATTWSTRPTRPRRRPAPSARGAARSIAATARRSSAPTAIAAPTSIDTARSSSVSSTVMASTASGPTTGRPGWRTQRSSEHPTMAPHHASANGATRSSRRQIGRG